MRIYTPRRFSTASEAEETAGFMGKDMAALGPWHALLAGDNHGEAWYLMAYKRNGQRLFYCQKGIAVEETP